MSAHPVVAVAADAAYLRHAAVVGASVCVADHGASVHLLAAPDVLPSELDSFSACIEQAGGSPRVHQIDNELVADLAVMPRIGQAMWYRTLLPSLLPHVERILYLDADVLVVDSLMELFTMDMGGSQLGAVDNVLEPSQRSRVANLTGGNERYFNSGVLLLDLAALRAESSMQRVLEVARARVEELQWPDQDALNLVFGRGRKHLHPRWNVMNSLVFWGDWAAEVFGEDVVTDAVARPAILHFEGPGPAKPWHRMCHHPWRDRYRDFASQTPWGPLKLDGHRFPRFLPGHVKRLTGRFRRA